MQPDEAGGEPLSDKRAKFRKLAERRTNQAIDAVRKIGNLSNRGNYDYSDDEVRRIFAALREAVDRAEEGFSDKPPQSHGFRL